MPDTTPGSALRLRTATPDDLSTIMRHRRQMFMDMGFREEASLAAMNVTSSSFIKRGLENGSYRGWLVEASQGVVAGGGIVLMEYPSSPRDPSLRRAYILNMYTEPAYRKQGLARMILHAMIAWCRAEGFKWVSLHASNDGRHLYETLGFKPTNEMRLELR